MLIGWQRDYSLMNFLLIILTISEGLLGETLSKFSIWGLYITFVLSVGQFIRLQCYDVMRIPFDYLPSCDT